MTGSEALERGRFAVAERESWIVENTFEFLDDDDTPEEAVGILLIDHQYRTEPSAAFHRSVNVLLNAEAVQKLSQVQIDFDPEIETLTVHRVAVWRDGIRADRDLPDRFRLIQREQNLERQIHDGRLSALFLIDDVRIGDAIDVDYTIAHDHPSYSGWFAAAETWSHPFPISRGVSSVLSPRDQIPNWKVAPNHQEPTKQEVGESHIRLVWDRLDRPALEEVPNAPIWFSVFETLQISTFRDWSDVTAWIQELWDAPPRSDEVAELAAQFRADSQNDFEAASRAVDFVQNEIRYQGLESGIGSLQPSPPHDVLQRRFGDCKDKAFLLTLLIRELGGTATPVLVNTSVGKGIASALPSPYAFDHVVVRYQHDGQIYDIDATSPYSGGSLAKRAPLPYGLGLPIAPDSASLVQMREPAPGDALLRVREDYQVGPYGQTTRLAISTVARGIEADRIRSLYSMFGAKKFTKFYEEALKEVFPKLSRNGELNYRDDQNANEIEIDEKFDIPEFTQRTDDGAGQLAAFFPHAFRGRVTEPPHTYPDCPWALDYPCSIRNRVTVHLPWNTQIRPESQRVQTPHFEFEFQSAQKSARSVEVRFGMDAKTDHVERKDLNMHRLRFQRMAELAQYIVVFSGNTGASWDSASVAGNPALAQEEAVAETHRRSHSPSLAWAGSGTLILVFAVIIFKIMSMAMRSSPPPRSDREPRPRPPVVDPVPPPVPSPFGDRTPDPFNDISIHPGRFTPPPRGGQGLDGRRNIPGTAPPYTPRPFDPNDRTRR